MKNTLLTFTVILFLDLQLQAMKANVTRSLKLTEELMEISVAQLKKKRLIYLEARVTHTCINRDRERKREKDLHLLLHSQDSLNI